MRRVLELWCTGSRAEAGSQLKEECEGVGRWLAARKRLQDAEAGEIAAAAYVAGWIWLAEQNPHEPTEKATEELRMEALAGANRYAAGVYRGRERRRMEGSDALDSLADPSRMVESPEEGEALKAIVQGAIEDMAGRNPRYAAEWRAYFFGDAAMPGKRARSCFRAALQGVIHRQLAEGCTQMALCANLIAYFEVGHNSGGREGEVGARHLEPLVDAIYRFVVAILGEDGWDEGPAGALAGT